MVKRSKMISRCSSPLLRNRVASFGNFGSSSSGSATAGKYKHGRPRTRVLCISYEPPLRSLRRALVPPRICLLYPVTSFIHASVETDAEPVSENSSATRDRRYRSSTASEVSFRKESPAIRIALISKAT